MLAWKPHSVNVEVGENSPITHLVEFTLLDESTWRNARTLCDNLAILANSPIAHAHVSPKVETQESSCEIEYRYGMEKTSGGVIVANLDRGLHRYRPLDSSGDEIRVLKLQPLNAMSGRYGSKNGDVEITLVHVRLEKSPAYSALSYRWGEDNEAETIIVDGHSVKISRTLKCALQEFRDSTETQMVWVDALCINQNDHKERNEQVSKMRQIYSHATNVVVWLGEGTPASTLAFSLISNLYDHLHDLEYLESAVLDRQRQPQWSAVVEMVRSVYWRRIWVIQEVNSARSKILRWGKNSMLWENFAAVQKQVLSARHTICVPAFAVGHSLDLWEAMAGGGPSFVNMPSTDPNSSGPPDL